jgi:hypothetical protein
MEGADGPADAAKNKAPQHIAGKKLNFFDQCRSNLPFDFDFANAAAWDVALYLQILRIDLYFRNRLTCGALTAA